MNDILLTPIRLTELETLIENSVLRAIKENSKSPESTNQLLTVKQAVEFLNLQVPTIYGLVHKREIPFMKKGKKLYFSQKELTDYVKTGRQKTTAEIEAESHEYLNNKKGGNSNEK